jgi:23S rRNA (uracil1939-C5)-methyltransferase
VKRGDELTVSLEKSAFEGKSIAHIDGMVVLVTGGVPGDEVKVRLSRVKKQYAEAHVTSLLSASSLRTTPRCRYAGECGGCVWQHVAYDAQLAFKREHVRDALERIGGFTAVVVNSTIGSDAVYYYRNKMEFSFGEKWIPRLELQDDAGSLTGRSESERFALGLHLPRRFDKVLDITECHLQSESSSRIVNAVRSFCLQEQLSAYSTRTHAGYLRNLAVRESANTNECMVNLVTSEDRADVMRRLTGHLLEQFPLITTVVNNITRRKAQVAVGEVEQVYHGPGFITERIGKRTYRISANSFFQTNTRQAERLYDVVATMGQLTPEDHVFDLYSGTGTIALHVADDVRGVVGIEAVASAVDDARKNASANNVDNCTFLRGDLKEKLFYDTQWLEGRPAPDLVIVDPPRAGMHEKVTRSLLALLPARIVYVSCNPATQARDLALLCSSSAYRIVGVQPVDMFPHTYHIENVVSLIRQL